MLDVPIRDGGPCFTSRTIGIWPSAATRASPQQATHSEHQCYKIGHEVLRKIINIALVEGNKQSARRSSSVCLSPSLSVSLSLPLSPHFAPCHSLCLCLSLSLSFILCCCCLVCEPLCATNVCVHHRECVCAPIAMSCQLIFKGFARESRLCLLVVCPYL